MFLTVIVFLLILSVLIFVHELGHFFVAKKSGIKVEEFGFGLPPRVWGKKIGETIYSLNLLPIGGFVRLYGEDLVEQESKRAGEQERMFWSKPKKVRAAVTIAGVVMNFLLALVVFSFLYTKLGIPTQTDQVRVVAINTGSPAQEAGLREGDIVLFAAGKAVSDTETFIEITQEYAGREMSLEITRDNDQNMLITVVPRSQPPAGEGPLGLGISSIEIKFYPFWEMPLRGAIEGLRESFAWTTLIVGSLGGMFYKLFTTGTLPQDVAGPVGIFQITGEVAKTGIFTVLQFLGILSINLAVVNILPLPALDGGRLLFIAIEALTGRRVSPKIEAYTHQIGMALLLFLVLLITFNDIRRIIGGMNVLDFIK